MTTHIAKEDSVAMVSATLKDEAGGAITDNRMTALRMWLFDANGAVINSRSDVDVLNANGATLDASGNFELRLTASDNPIVDSSAGTYERHVLLLKKVWDVANPQQDWDEIEIFVKNLQRVPVS